jgi:ABC-type transporter MlaC component
VERYVDIGGLGRSSAGAVWQRAEPTQQDGYLVAFRNFLIVSYVGSIARADDLHFTPATVVSADAQHALVRTEVTSSDGVARPILITVTWSDDAGCRITDIAAEGISLRSLLSADFGAFLRRNGGRLEALMDRLRDKVAARLAAN